MNSVLKTVSASILILLCISLATSSTSEQAIGMGQEVEVGVDRANHGFFTSLSIYCRTYELDTCQNGFGWGSVIPTLWHYLTVDDPEQWYEENNGEEAVEHFNLS